MCSRLASFIGNDFMMLLRLLVFDYGVYFVDMKIIFIGCLFFVIFVMVIVDLDVARIAVARLVDDVARVLDANVV